MRPVSGDVTIVLKRWSDGESAALQELIDIIYCDLRKLANRNLQRERAGHTLQCTALVHELYLRLVDQNSAQWQNRQHFFAIASQIMRRILVDHARRHQSEKRGRAISPLSLDDALMVPIQRNLNIVALDECLGDLAAIDAQKSQVVELRFFGGLSMEEISEVLQITPAAVKKDWTMAKAWLYRSMGGGAEA